MPTNQTPAPVRDHQRRPTYSKDRHPHYFGHYLNQARHNAYMIVADLEDEYGIAREANDLLTEENLAASPLLRLLDASGQPDVTARLLRDLTRQSPFFNASTATRMASRRAQNQRPLKKP